MKHMKKYRTRIERNRVKIPLNYEHAMWKKKLANVMESCVKITREDE